MKIQRTLLILTTFLFSTVVLSQNKPPQSIKKPTPTGFGKFKIGKTTINELQLPDSTYTWFSEVENKIDTITGNGIEISDYGYEFSESLIYSGLFYGKNVKMGLIKEYRIGEEKLNLVLVFYKDTLIQLTTTDFNSEIYEQWKLKYGDGVFANRKKTIKCTTKFGDYNEFESYSTTSWGTPTSKILAIWEFDEYYDSKCEKQYMDYFMVYSPSKKKIVESISIKHVSMVIGKVEEKKKQQAINSDL